MKWKKLPYWLKGGIIGMGIGILAFLGLWIYSLTIPKSIFTGLMIDNRQPNVLIILLLIPIGIAVFLTELIGVRNSSILGLIFSLLFSFIIYFTIGAFIGWIIGKVKRK